METQRVKQSHPLHIIGLHRRHRSPLNAQDHARHINPLRHVTSEVLHRAEEMVDHGTPFGIPLDPIP